MSRRPGARFVFPAAVAVILCGAAASVLAQLVVFDPSNYAEAVQEFVQLQRQYQQLIQTYELMAVQARRAPGDLDARYRSLATPWFNLSAPDTYGTTAGWVHSANTGWDVPAGYRAATEPLQAYGGGFDALPADEAARIKTAYGSVELGDGINLHALETLGHLRGHATDVEAALRRLEDDSYAPDPAMNTQIAVLNKVNAASVTAARLTKDTNQLLISILEGQLVDAKRRRDAEAAAINAHIAFEAAARDLLRRTSDGTADALTRFRLP